MTDTLLKPISIIHPAPRRGTRYSFEPPSVLSAMPEAIIIWALAS